MGYEHRVIKTDDMEELQRRLNEEAHEGFQVHEITYVHDEWEGRVYAVALMSKYELGALDPVIEAGSISGLAAAAVYGFMGWLTSRDEAVGPFSKKHDAARAAELAQEYIEMNGWNMPEHWNGRMPELANGPKGEGRQDNG